MKDDDLKELIRDIAWSVHVRGYDELVTEEWLDEKVEKMLGMFITKYTCI